MNNIDVRLKKELISLLIEESGLIPSDEKLVEFLDEILKLRILPAIDDRYNNAYDDAVKHLVHNDDWSLEYVFFERFSGFLEDDEKFLLFIEKIVDPRFRKDNDEINRLELLITPFLRKIEKTFILDGYSKDGFKLLKIEEFNSEADYNINILQNSIPFFIIKYNCDAPLTYPCFVLEEIGWDDYSVRATFKFKYVKSKSDINTIGTIKIFKKNIRREDFKDLNSTLRIAERLPTKFTYLDESFCTLGQTEDYYNNLKENFNDEQLKSTLYSLRDIAFFETIYEEFEDEPYFKSTIIREDGVEKLSRIIKYKLYGYDLSKLYSFKYSFIPKFSPEDSIELDFNYSNDRDGLSNRIKCLIGKNGTSKTQIVSRLPISISENEYNNFYPQIPRFSKIIAISYSVFDNFKIPKSNEEFNYVYCGIKNSVQKQLSGDALFQRFFSSLIQLKKKQRLKVWNTTVHSILGSDVIDIGREWDNDYIEVDLQLKEAEIRRQVEILSSGQSIMVYIMTELINNIRLNSLLIYDEPETHLHPNAISSLINSIIKLTEEFDSFCLIATHSPLIVRELFSKDVLILEKEANVLSIRKPSVETFAENLSVITEDIFNNRDIKKNYISVIKGIIQDSETKDYDRIMSDLKNKGINLSLNARLYLKMYLDEKHSS